MRAFSRTIPQPGKSVLVGEGDRLGAVACVNLGEQLVDVGLTVPSLTTSCSAISLFDVPLAMSDSTSASRGVRPAGRDERGRRSWAGDPVAMASTT